MRWVAAVAMFAVVTAAGAPSLAVAQTLPTSVKRVYREFIRGGGVDYARLTQDPILMVVKRDLAEVSKDRLQQEPEQARVAFWINAYNMLTIDLITQGFYPPEHRQLKSIKEIPGAWSRPKWTVAGRRVTLDQIEHEILRKEFREPRIHFALVCASKSCPALQARAFAAKSLDADLDSAAREFVRNPSRNDFTPRDGAIRISKIFDWYGKDFVGVYSDPTFERLYGREMGAVLAYVARFLPAESVTALRAKRVRVKYLPYDWSLNIAPSR